jgi:hypothetical protein
MVVAVCLSVCLSIMFIVLMGVCESERCHVMPSRTMLASRQVCWSCGQVQAQHSGASLVESTSSSGVLPASTSLCLCRRSPVAGSSQALHASEGQSECSDHTYLRSNLPCLKALQNRPDDLTTSHTENRLGIDQQHGYRPWSDMVPAEKTSSDGVPRIT